MRRSRHPCSPSEACDWAALADGQTDAETDDVEAAAEAAGSDAAAAASTPAAMLAHDVKGAEAVRRNTQQCDRMAAAEEKVLAGEHCSAV